MSVVIQTSMVLPEAVERRGRPGASANLQTAVEWLLNHLTPVFCENVYKQCRQTERERKWTFHAVIQFWTAMIVERPRAIEHGVAETRKGRGRDKLWPKVNASARAFLKKAANLRPHLFQALYESFVSHILPEAPASYASWLKPLREQFADVLIVDGSRLDAVCRRLKITRNIRAARIPINVATPWANL